MIKINYNELKHAMLCNNGISNYYVDRDGIVIYGDVLNETLLIPESSVSTFDEDVDYFLMEVEVFFGDEVTLTT